MPNNDFSITIENGTYCVKFPYSPRDVQALKDRIPSTNRTFDGTRKCWIIAASEKRNIENIFGVSCPDIINSKPKTEVRLIEVRYLGQCKERAPGEISAMGLLKNGQWGAIFPMGVLTAWFENTETVNPSPASFETLYMILGAKQSDDDNAIKQAYRRMARQWHPDLCREPNAHERFLRIKEAYDILSVPRSRGRYDAGLALEATIKKDKPFKTDIFDMAIYRSPLRCGFILCEGSDIIGRFVVSKILGWDDITDKFGRVLVTSWAMGDNAPTEVWS